MLTRRSTLLLPLATGFVLSEADAAPLNPRVGVTSAALQAAIDEAQSSGEVLVLQAGTYRVDGLRIEDWLTAG